jgi:hypothetical protein
MVNVPFEVDYVPQPRELASVTNDIEAMVTTTEPHQYVTGQVIKFFVPMGFGMYELNSLQVKLTVVDDISFTIPVDSRQFNPFVVPSFPPAYTPAQALPQTGEGYNTYSKPAMTPQTPLIINGSYVGRGGQQS